MHYLSLHKACRIYCIACREHKDGFITPTNKHKIILVLSLSLVCASYSCQCCCADGVANDYPLLRCIYILDTYTHKKFLKIYKTRWKLYREDSWKTRIINNFLCSSTNLSEYENLNTERIFIYKNHCYHKIANLSTLYNKLLLIITTIWKIVIIGILLLTSWYQVCYSRMCYLYICWCCLYEQSPAN